MLLVEICLIGIYNISGVLDTIAGSAHSSGGHGEPVLYKRHGAGIVGGRLRSRYVRKKIGCRMLWQMRLEPPRASVSPCMHPSFPPMHCGPYVAIMHRVPNCHVGYSLCCFRSHGSLILQLRTFEKVWSSVMFVRNILFILLSKRFCLQHGLLFLYFLREISRRWVYI